jgi:hypothetical protein
MPSIGTIKAHDPAEDGRQRDKGARCNRLISILYQFCFQGLDGWPTAKLSVVGIPKDHTPLITASGKQVELEYGTPEPKTTNLVR